MCDRAGNILAPEPAINANRLGKLLNLTVGRARESATPGFSGQGDLPCEVAATTSSTAAVVWLNLLQRARAEQEIHNIPFVRLQPIELDGRDWPEVQAIDVRGVRIRTVHL
jgi:hypothetical protein